MSGIGGFKNLQSNELVKELSKYINSTLPHFVASDEFVNITAKKKNENQHSKAVCVFLTNACQSKFCFQGENAQKGSCSVDIRVYRGSVLFYTIEAKVLPIPERSEHEYVYGTGGGIQRFKDEKHGLNNIDQLLPFNGMIAYIKDQDFDYWHNQTNTWIEQAKWSDAEKLQIIDFNEIGHLKSVHQKSGGSKVHLDHFWVYVTEQDEN